MSLLEVQDLPPQFQQELGQPQYFIDDCNKVFDAVARQSQGVFAALANDIGNHARGIVDALLQGVSLLYPNSGIPTQQETTKLMEFALGVYASNFLNGGGDQRDQANINNLLNRNPILQKAQQRDSYNGGRGGYSQGGYGQSSYGSRGSYGNQSNHNRGNVVARGQNQRSPFSNYSNGTQPQQQNDRGYAASSNSTVQRNTSRQQKGSTMNKEETRPLELVPQSGDLACYPLHPNWYRGGLAPIYTLYGTLAQYEEKRVILVDASGEREVDYEKHRVSRIYPELLEYDNSNKVAYDATMAAIKEAQKAMDNAIDSYIKPEVKPESDEQGLPEPIQLKESKSFIINELLTSRDSTMNPIEVRTVLEQDHGVTLSTLSNHAVVVRVDYELELSADRDVYLKLEKFLNARNYQELIRAFIDLNPFIDAVVWRKLHDILTDRINIVLLDIACLGLTLDSITADWAGLVKLLNEKEAKVTAAFNAGFAFMTQGFAAVENDFELFPEGKHRIAIPSTNVYMPITTSDLELYSTQSGYGSIPENSELYALVSSVNDASDGSERVIRLVTYDGSYIDVLARNSFDGIHFLATFNDVAKSLK